MSDLIAVVRYYRRKPVQSYCQHCGELFVYFQLTKRRLYCDPCIPLEARDANDFWNSHRKAKRRIA